MKRTREPKPVYDTDENSETVIFRSKTQHHGFAILPHLLTMDITISDGAYRTYALLLKYAMQKRTLKAGIDTMAEDRGRSASTIREHIKELVDEGLISRRRRMGTSSTTIVEDIEKLYNVSRKTSSRIAEKSADLQPKDRPAEEEEGEEEEDNKNTPTSNAIEETGIYPLASALAVVCGMDLALNSGMLFKSAKRLESKGYCAQQVVGSYSPGKWWYTSDWRGLKGQRPNIAAINQTIMDAVKGPAALVSAQESPGARAWRKKMEATHGAE